MRLKRFPLLLLLFLSACAPAAPRPLASPPTAAPELPAAVPSATLAPSVAPPPATTPSITPSLVPTLTPTATLHPMAILSQRQTPYPGSLISIERTLEPGANYQRYYAYYLSEGLKIYALLTVPNGERPAGGWPAIVFNHGYIPPDQYRTRR